MKWGKFLLVFQAIVTLIIGIVFLIEVFAIEEIQSEEKENIVTKDAFSKRMDDLSGYSKRLQEKFFSSSYIIITISLIEVVLIWRMFEPENPQP